MSLNIWEKAKERIKEELSDLSFQTWIEPLKVIAINGSQNLLVLGLNRPDTFIFQVINDRYRKLIENTVSHYAGRDVTIEILLPNQPLPEDFEIDFDKALKIDQEVDDVNCDLLPNYKNEKKRKQFLEIANLALAKENKDLKNFIAEHSLEESFEIFTQSDRDLSSKDLKLYKEKENGFSILPSQKTGTLQVVFLRREGDETLKLTFYLPKEKVIDHLEEIFYMSDSDMGFEKLTRSIKKIKEEDTDEDLPDLSVEMLSLFLSTIKTPSKGSIQFFNKNDARKLLTAALTILPMPVVYFNNCTLKANSQYKAREEALVISSNIEMPSLELDQEEISSPIKECILSSSDKFKTLIWSLEKTEQFEMDITVDLIENLCKKIITPNRE